VNAYPGKHPEGGAFFNAKTGVMAYTDGLVWAGFVRDGRESALQAGGRSLSFRYSAWLDCFSRK